LKESFTFDKVVDECASLTYVFQEISLLVQSAIAENEILICYWKICNNAKLNVILELLCYVLENLLFCRYIVIKQL
jgi:hypothetical protein